MVSTYTLNSRSSSYRFKGFVPTARRLLKEYLRTRTHWLRMIHTQANVFYFWSIENRLKKNEKQQIPAGYRIHITCFIVSQLSVAHWYFILLSPNLEPQTSPILFELTKTIDFFLAYQVLTRLWFHDDTIQIYDNAWCKRSKEACHDVLCMLYLWRIRFCSDSKWSKSS